MTLKISRYSCGLALAITSLSSQSWADMAEAEKWINQEFKDSN